MREYGRFEEGAANSNTSAAVLQRRLEDPNARIIITTIQKLALRHQEQTPGVRPHGGIFDEYIAVSSATYAEITRVFQRYHLFGFTGTPIFAENSGAGATHGGAPRSRRLATSCTPTPLSTPSTTRMCCRFASTTSTRSNCLRGSRTNRYQPSTPNGHCWHRSASHKSRATSEHFDQKTKRASSYRHDGKRLIGFNSLFACASIDAASYYAEFAEQQKALPEAQRLKIG